MNPSEREQLIDAWLIAHQAGTKSPIYEENWWAVEIFLNLPQENPELLWELILETLSREKNEKLLGNLAAGPLEDLIEYNGPAFIDRIEEIARKDPKFKKLLQGVWESSTPAIWNRIEKIQNQ